MKVTVTYNQTDEEVKLSFEPSENESDNMRNKSDNMRFLLKLQKQGWAQTADKNVFSSPVSAFTSIDDLEGALSGYEIKYDTGGAFSKYDKEVDGMLRNSAGASTPEIEARWKETARELLQEYFDNNPIKPLSR